MRAEEANFERWYGGKRGCEGTRHGKDVNFRMHKAVCKRTSKTLVGRRDFAELGGLSVVNDGTDEKAARYPPLSSDIHYKHATPDFLATISTRTVVQNEHKRWNAAETRVESVLVVRVAEHKHTKTKHSRLSRPRLLLVAANDDPPVPDALPLPFFPPIVECPLKPNMTMMP